MDLVILRTFKVIRNDDIWIGLEFDQVGNITGKTVRVIFQRDQLVNVHYRSQSFACTFNRLSKIWTNLLSHVVLSLCCAFFPPLRALMTLTRRRWRTQVRWLDMLSSLKVDHAFSERRSNDRSACPT